VVAADFPMTRVIVIGVVEVEVIVVVEVEVIVVLEKLMVMAMAEEVKIIAGVE